MSGKQSKKVRRSKKISKKAVAGAAAAILCAAPVAAEGGEFLVSLFPHFSFPVVKFDDALTTGFGGGLRLTYKPTDYFGIFLQGDYKQFSFDTANSIGNLSVMDATAGAGYYLSITDRLGLNFDAGVGYYYANYATGKGSNKSSTPLSGFNVGGSISVSYKIGPAISVYASGGAQHYAYKNSKFITSVDANPGITFNISRAFSQKNNISVEEAQLKPVFPVFYSWYNDNSFGAVEVCNEEDSTITDVTVYFYQQQYMGQPRDCAKAKSLKKGEKLTVDLKAFFNENMLSLNEKSDTLANIIVEYKYLGSKRTETFPMIVPVYGRNNMSWEDDRCASAFVSSKDPAAMWFAKYVTSTVRDEIRSGVPQNIQYAMAVFQALDQFGINYVKDPTSAFEDNVGTASIDFLQFPYQTLMYRGGDCDDLSILTCSLFESIGIKTAFITIPGHIFMAFDSGLSLAEAKDYFDSLDNFIVDGNKVWVPLEITLSDEGFNKAWHKGAWEWNTANRTGDAMIYPMEDSWKIYKPVSVPGAAAKFTLPEESLVAKSFSSMVDEFVIAQITPQIASFENLLVKAPTAQNYNDFGILYARYGLFEQAEEQFRLARISKYLPSILNTANLYYSQKDYTKAAAWYKQVLAADNTNNLAMLGLARCAYETGDYNECDRWYGTVYKNDRTLAKQYSYLGAFEQTNGRSFSLADRLENTVWVQSAEYNMRNGVITSVLPVVPNTSVTPQTSAVVLQTSEPVEKADGLENISSPLAIAPGNIPLERRDDEEQSSAGGAGASGSGSGDGDGDDEYKGISSQLDFNILSAQDLAMLAQDSIVENGESLDDFDASSYSLSVKEDKLIDTTYVTSIMTDVPVREPGTGTGTGTVLPDGRTVLPAGTSAVPEPVEGPAAIAAAEKAEAEATLAAFTLTQEAFAELVAAAPAVAKIDLPDLPEIDLPTKKEVNGVIGGNAVSKNTSKTNAKAKEKETWVPELVEGLKELDKTTDAASDIKSEAALRQAQGAQSSTGASTVNTYGEAETTVNTYGEVETTVNTDVKTVVPEPVEGPQSPTVETQQPPKKSNKKIYIGFAALAAALAALFIGLKKKGKRND